MQPVFTGEDAPLTTAPIPSNPHLLPKQVFGWLFACYLTGEAQHLFGFDIPRHVAGAIDVRKRTQPCIVIDKQGNELPATLFIEQRYGSTSSDDSNPLGVLPTGYIVLDTDSERLGYHKGKDKAEEQADKDRAALSYTQHTLSDMRRRGVAPTYAEPLLNELSGWSPGLTRLLFIEETQKILRQWRDDHDCPADRDDHDVCTCNEFDQVLDGLDNLTKLIK